MQRVVALASTGPQARSQPSSANLTGHLADHLRILTPAEQRVPPLQARVEIRWAPGSGQAGPVQLCHRLWRRGRGRVREQLILVIPKEMNGATWDEHQVTLTHDALFLANSHRTRTTHNHLGLLRSLVDMRTLSHAWRHLHPCDHQVLRCEVAGIEQHMGTQTTTLVQGCVGKPPNMHAHRSISVLTCS